MAGALHLPKLHMPSMPGFSGDDEDYADVFEEMTLAEHLDELRSRLVKTCIGIGLAFIVGLFLTRPLLGVVRDNANVERFDVIDATEPITDVLQDRAVYRDRVRASVDLLSNFRVRLSRHDRKEKRYLYGSLPFVVIFFLLGVAFAFFLAIPQSVRILVQLQ